MGGTPKCYQLQAFLVSINVKRLTLEQKARVSLKKNSHNKPHENITRKNLRLVQILPFPKYPVLHVHL